MKQSLGRLSFDYRDPAPGFDRRTVKGLAASLIQLAEAHYDKATALEIAAGGKLYQVVVDNERVGSELLKNGQLKKRVTLIPLNKISNFKLSPKVRLLHLYFSPLCETDYRLCTSKLMPQTVWRRARYTLLYRSSRTRRTLHPRSPTSLATTSSAQTRQLRSA